MLEEIVIQFWESANLQNRHKLVAELTGLSERRLRGTSQEFRPSTIVKANAHARSFILKRLQQNSHTSNEALAWLDTDPKSFSEGLIYGTEVTNEVEYPLTRALARRIDDLGAQIILARSEDDLPRVKDLLLATNWLDDRYFSEGQAASSSLQLRDQVRCADTWTAIHKPYATAAANALFSLLALWDVELSGKHFRRFQPRSVFALLLPWIVGGIAEPVIPRRNMFRFPVRRLIDLSATLAHFYRHESWPEQCPQVKNLVLDGNEGERNFVNWRDGSKRFGHAHFEQLWSALFPERIHNGKPNRVRPLYPLYVAATIFQNLLVEVDTNSRTKTIQLHDSHYLYWWKIHAAEMRQASGGTFGDIPWPAWLTEP